jgi:hypothetical protein
MPVRGSSILGRSRLFPSLVLCIICGQFKSADWALVVLTKPFPYAFFVEKMTTRHLSSLVFEVFAADRASRILVD